MIILVDEINRSKCRCYFTTRNFFRVGFSKSRNFHAGKEKNQNYKDLIPPPYFAFSFPGYFKHRIKEARTIRNRRTYNRPWFQSRLKLFFFFLIQRRDGSAKKKEKKERARFGIEWNDCCFNGVIYGIHTHTPIPFVHISIRSGIDDRPLYRRDTRGTVVTRKRIRVYASPNTDVRIFLDCISRNTSYTHRQYRADLLRHENLC